MVGTNYILCSVGSKPNQNKNKQTTPPPLSQESSKKERRKSYRAYRFQGHSMALLTRMCTQLCYLPLSPSGIYDQTGTQKQSSYQVLSTSIQLPFLHFLSRIRVFFLHERSAVYDGRESLIPGARTLISRPLKPLSVQNAVWRQA